MFAWRCNVCDSRRVHTRCVNTHTWYGQKGDARAYIRVRVLHLRQSWPWMRLATASDYACIVKKTIWFIFHFSFFFFFSFFFLFCDHLIEQRVSNPVTRISLQDSWILWRIDILRGYIVLERKNKRYIGEKGNVGN